MTTAPQSHHGLAGLLLLQVFAQTVDDDVAAAAAGTSLASPKIKVR